MNRNLSITEFINSFTLGKTLYPNTLKYLYSADSQNGLYVCKAPKNSGTNTFINLLTLYRIANLVIDPTASNFGAAPLTYHIYWHTWQASLAMKAIKDFLEQSTLFAKTSSEDLHSRSVLDKLHIYYCYEDVNVISFARVKLIFTNLMEPYPLGKVFETSAYKCQGIVYELYEGGSPINEVNDPFYDWFEKLLGDKVYTHPDFRLSKSLNSKTPFCIINSSKIFKWAPLEFNNIDTIEFTAPPFCKDLDSQCNELETSSEVYAYLKCRNLECRNLETGGTKTDKKTTLCPPKFELNENCEEVLRDEFGLYKDWDYGPKKKDTGEEKERKSKPDDFGLTDFIHKGKKYAALISNQSKYMIHFIEGKTDLEKRDLFANVSKILNTKIESEADVLKYLMDIFSDEVFSDDCQPCLGLCNNNWRVMERFGAVNVGAIDNPAEAHINNIYGLYCDKQTLIKQMNSEEHMRDELIIGIPLDLETGFIRGIWRRNMLAAYYSCINV